MTRNTLNNVADLLEHKNLKQAREFKLTQGILEGTPVGKIPTTTLFSYISKHLPEVSLAEIEAIATQLGADEDE